MSNTELRALTALGFDELRQATGGLGSIQQAVAGRVFRAVGPGAVAGASRSRGDHARRLRRPRPRHAGDRPGRGHRGGPAGGARRPVHDAARQRADRRRHRPARRRPRGRGQPALPADGGARERRAGRARPGALREAFPEATPRVVVFVHGLMTTEFSWRLGGREPFGDRLARDLGCTPVYVRYNSGRHISENGRSLSELMDELVAAWPVEARAGRARGPLDGRARGPQRLLPRTEDDADWARLVTHSVSLGTPAHGRAAGAGGARAERRARRAAGDASVRQLPAPPQRRASATCARDRSWTRTGATTIRTPCAGPRARRCRCSRAPRTASCRPRSPAATATRSAGCSATRWCSCRARRAGAGRGESPSRRSTGCTSGAPATSRCSTDPAVYEKLRAWLA